MRYEEKTVRLKDGRTCLIRSPEASDAAEMLAFLADTAGETDFLARGPDDVLMDEESEKAFLQKVLDSPREVMLTALAGDAIIAFASVFLIRERVKMRHRALFCISIRKAFWHQGLGRLMTDMCIHLAREMGYEQLELQTFSGNLRARRMYGRAGFETWGRVRNGFKLKDGSYQDEVTMGLFLREKPSGGGGKHES